MLRGEWLAGRLVLWGREFSLGLGSRQNSQFGFTKFSICAYKILNVYGCECCKVLVVSGLLVIVLDYFSTFILVVKEQ